ncbi:SMI1/KNR4 family protein [Nocardia araoensis]|uniref:SMI1/KNR4 family protein n=1 Tax=Nocardia araoensis TaxID=228600 RepID=UPI00030D18E4|nr:SMI1/KNR4 family protein [Nocardia araoensis]
MPGASAADIDDVVRRVGDRLPPLLRDLLTWRNGQSEDYFGSLEFYWSLMSAGDIASTMDEMARIAATEGLDELEWSTAWVPFLQNSFGDYLCIDLQGAFGGEPGQLIKYGHDDEFRNIVWPSLEAWLETLVAAFEAGMFESENEARDGRFDPTDWGAYEAFVVERLPGYPIEVCLSDSRHDSPPDRGKETDGKELVHAVDPDRLRAALRHTGLSNDVVDGAFARLTEIRAHREATGEE